MDLPHAVATKPAIHNLTMGDLTHATMNVVAASVGMRPDQLDPDETVINLSTTAFELAVIFGRVARKLGLIMTPEGDDK